MSPGGPEKKVGLDRKEFEEIKAKIVQTGKTVTKKEMEEPQAAKCQETQV